ncbi:retrovirus-related Pol polyprotein from transposon TNT 1-94 [Nephila pilipes]|uniref:Retrovirus-related Pol polyprotein from transposon TNT 1-94 n=1 Tax=Nephila pilipes TaxID=299642 RepID=A0A8X6N2C6_NEPPI|nr:retrovirus-related Pol polyprotein from transposon TNT 1-94 [Nephila pilipes]
MIKTQSQLCLEEFGLKLSQRQITSTIELSTKLKKKTPFELRNGRKPDVSKTTTFGSRALPYVHKSKRGKLDAKAIEGILIVYDQRSKGYRIYILDHHVIIRTTASFIEDNEKENNVTITPLQSTEIININEESDDEQVSYRGRETPTEKDWGALKKLIRYLNITKDFNIINIISPPVLTSYTDWACDTSTTSSTSGNVFPIWNNHISWFAKKQYCIALSSCESEYIAAAQAAKEIQWLLKDLILEQHQPIRLFEKNKSCIIVAQTRKSD